MPDLKTAEELLEGEVFRFMWHNLPTVSVHLRGQPKDGKLYYVVGTEDHLRHDLVILVIRQWHGEAVGDAYQYVAEFSDSVEVLLDTIRSIEC